MSGTIYLISGANRGIGLALVNDILTKHANAFVYAGARDPKKAVALKEIEAKYPGRVSVVKCVSANVDGNAAIAKEIEQRHGRVDTVIANAGLGESTATAVDTSLSSMEDHFRVNVFGPLVLFQAMFNLLKKSTNPRFVPISSQAASLDGYMVRLPQGAQTAYGSSKAALNWVTRKIHFENEWLVAFPQCPGPVNTEMFQHNVAILEADLIQRWTSVAAKPEDAAASIMNIVDNSTRETHGGEFYGVDGEKIPF